MRSVCFGVIAAVVVCAASPAAALAAGSADRPHAGEITYTEDSIANGSGTVVIGGAFADYGTDRAGALDDGTVNVVTLRSGTFEVDIARLQRSVRVSIDRATCVYVESARAPARLFAGTGAYSGISGTLNVRVQATGVLPRLPGGRCAGFTAAEPLVAVSTAVGSGRVRFERNPA